MPPLRRSKWVMFFLKLTHYYAVDGLLLASFPRGTLANFFLLLLNELSLRALANFFLLLLNDISLRPLNSFTPRNVNFPLRLHFLFALFGTVE